ncbi:MAG: SDR family NAD(P)-dependent oxidoreductase [Pseudonocardiaceae bacterium]
MHLIEEQTVLVTGATSGLGRALAQRLAGAGATVVVHRLADDHEVVQGLMTARLPRPLA